MNNETTNRRQWMTATARWGALGAVAAVWLRVSTSGSGAAEQRCIDLQGRTGCRACGLFDRCGLPRALSVKQVLKDRADEQANS